MAIAVSHDGLYCVGGSASGRLFLWETSGGELLRTWDAHYKAISAVCFTGDGTFIVSGGEDALVCVWDTAQIVASGASV